MLYFRSVKKVGVGHAGILLAHCLIISYTSVKIRACSVAILHYSKRSIFHEKLIVFGGKQIELQ
jgi:hypothetical protein